MLFKGTKFSWNALESFARGVKSGKVQDARKVDRHIERAQIDTATKAGLPKKHNPPSKSTKPPDAVLERAKEAEVRFRKMKERSAKRLIELRDEWPGLDLWCEVVEEEFVNGAAVVKQGVLDWDILGGLEYAGMLEPGIPQEVRWAAYHVLAEHITKLGKRKYGKDDMEMWFSDPWPKAWGGWTSDRARCKKALGLT